MTVNLFYQLAEVCFNRFVGRKQSAQLVLAPLGPDYLCFFKVADGVFRSSSMPPPPLFHQRFDQKVVVSKSYVVLVVT